MSLLPTITTTDVQEQRPEAAVLPIGSFEQHGPYLPLITDTAIASIIVREITATYPVLTRPPALTIACSHEHGTWPGTVSISARTLMTVIEDIRESLAQSGISKLILVNAHGGNYVLSNIVQEANVLERRMSLFPRVASGTAPVHVPGWSQTGTGTCTRERSRRRSCSMPSPGLSAPVTRLPTTTPASVGSCSPRGCGRTPRLASSASRRTPQQREGRGSAREPERGLQSPSEGSLVP